MPSNITRKSAHRKQQTRLTFDPIDRSSSPAGTTNMSPAKVRYQLPNLRNTPSSSRPLHALEEIYESDELGSSRIGRVGFGAKTAGEMGHPKKKKNDELQFKPLPTPDKSSQMARNGNGVVGAIESDEGDLHDNQIRSDHRISAKKSKNEMRSYSSRLRTRAALSFVNESGGSAPEDDVETPFRKKNKGKGKGKLFSLNLGHGSAGDEVTEPPSKTTRLARPSSSSKPLQPATGRRQESVLISSDSDDQLVFPVPKHSTKRKVPRSIKQEAPAEDDEDSDIPLPTSSILRRGRKSFIPDDDENDADGPILSKLMNCSKSPQKESSRSQTVELRDDSDDAPIKSSFPRRKPRISISADEYEDGGPITSLMKARDRRKRAAESEDSDIASLPQKRRRQSSDEDEDEDSDLPSLNDITSKSKDKAKSRSDINTPTPTRITRQLIGRKNRTAKEKQMELLRRRRAGEDIDEVTDSTEASDEPKRGVYDSDSDLEMLNAFEDESESEEEAELPRKKAKKRANDDNYELSEDSDFVVNDEDGPIGVPGLSLADIPLQFRHAAHKPLKEHFKDAIEWMVHQKINPAFPRNDPVYRQAFLKLDDEYHGYANSKFVSTQWTAEFTKAIYARPIFIERGCAEGEGYTSDGVPKCDVCNHRNHHPKFMIHFEGKAYHKDTLEEVERDSEDEDEDDDDDVVSVNSKGQSLPAEDKEWASGNVCRDNAQQAHALIHWKYALNEWVMDQLEREDYLTPDKLAEREKMKAKQRRNYANNLVDGWENDGVIKDLYGDFKRQLETARNSKQGRWERGPGHRL